MVNSLRNDPVIRQKFQFWFYEYTSNLPILRSAADLRDVVTRMVNQLDPQHQDPALQKMVVIGHSQGGTFGFQVAEQRPDKFKAFVAVEASSPGSRVRSGWPCRREPAASKVASSSTGR